MSLSNRISLYIIAILFLVSHAPLTSSPTFGLYDLDLASTQRSCPSDRMGNHPYRRPIVSQHQDQLRQRRDEQPSLLVRPIPAAPPGHNAHRNAARRRQKLCSAMPGKRLSELRDLTSLMSLDQTGTFHDSTYLADLAITYNDQARLTKPQDPQLGEIYHARATACQLAADNPEVLWRLQPTEVAPAVLEVFPELAPFESSIAQVQLRRELISHCEAALYQQANYHSTDTLSGLTPMVLQLSANALATTDPMVGFHLADACHHLLNAGKYLAKISRGIGKGTLNFAQHAIEFLKQCVLHPWDTTKEIALQSVKAAGLALGAALILSIENPTALEREAQFALIDQATDLLKAARRDPEKAAAVITELLLTQASITKGCRLATRSLRNLKNSCTVGCLIDDVRSAYLRLTGKSVAAPAGIDPAAYEASLASYQTILKSDPAAMKMAEELAAKSPKPAAAARLAREQALADPVVEAQKTALARTVEYQEQILVEGRRLYPTNPRFHMPHFNGEIRTNFSGKSRLVGAHLAEISLPGATVEDLGPINNLGCRAKKIKVGKLTKYSTTFPSGLDAEMAKAKALEAWLNPIEKSESGSCFTGITKDGILIRICLQKDLEMPGIYIETAYPISAGKSAELIAKNKALKG